MKLSARNICLFLLLMSLTASTATYGFEEMLQKRYQIYGPSEPFNARETCDGDIITATTYSGGKLLLTRFDHCGNPELKMGYELSPSTFMESRVVIREIMESGAAKYVIAGTMTPGDCPGVYLLKVDANGAIVWFNTFAVPDD